MSIRKPFNFLQWIEENKDLLKPPVGNKCVYTESEDFIIMVVGGPNVRKDYHYNETEEFFYQIKGDIVVRIQEDGKAIDVPIKEGEVFLLPAKVPHSPMRQSSPNRGRRSCTLPPLSPSRRKPPRNRRHCLPTLLV